MAKRLAIVASRHGRAVLVCGLGEGALDFDGFDSIGSWGARRYALATDDGADFSESGHSSGSLRIGVARYPDHAHDPAELILAADRAARDAAPGGRHEARHRVGGRRPAAEPQALAEGRLTLHYQPQVSLADGRIRGLEALVRIHRKGEDGEAQWVSGGTTAIEQIHEIVPWTFAQAHADLAAWRAQGLSVVPIAVNLPLACLDDQAFCRRIAEIFAADPDLARDIEIELTEDQPPGDLVQVCDDLRRLKDSGLRLALDDVGTGFAGVSLLERLPLDTLKIDRIFVARLPDDSEALDNVRALVALGRAYGLQVVGEGVELPEQREALAQSGCDLYQGYAYSAPVSAEAIGRLLRA